MIWAMSAAGAEEAGVGGICRCRRGAARSRRWKRRGPALGWARLLALAPPAQYERRYRRSQLQKGDWVVSARNVSQLDVGANTARYRIEPVWTRSVLARPPLRTAHADSGAGFYSHRAGYTPFAGSRWSRSASGAW